MSYESDIEIDENALDVEWLDQPGIMRRYCDAAAEAQRVMDLAKEQLDFVEATLMRSVRAAPEEYDVKPGSRGITEDSIKEAVRTNEQYRTASRAHITAKYEYEVARGAVRAADHRKTSLENLVGLFGRQYFAGPSVPRDLSVERIRRDRDYSAQRKVRISQPSGRPPPAPREDDDVRLVPRFERKN